MPCHWKFHSTAANGRSKGLSSENCSGQLGNNKKWPRNVQQKMSKTVLTVFVDQEGVVHYKCAPQGQTVNNEYYLTVLMSWEENGLTYNEVMTGCFITTTHLLVHLALSSSIW